MKKIIFVCTGNTCRSPMAEKISQKIAEERNLNCQIESRGIAVFRQEPANDHAIHALISYGLDLKQHISRGFELEDALEDTLILTMTQQHKYQLLSYYPNIKNNTFNIYEYVGEKGDIDDPYGRPLEAYVKCANQLHQIITKVFDKLEEN